jgi:hypothetical protein
VSGVKRKSPEEGHRKIGFQISGDGKCIAQKKAMKAKYILFGEAIRGGTIWRGKSDMAYNSFYMPSQGYGTPATALTKKDCEEIQRPVVNSILPKMHSAVSTEGRCIWCGAVWRTGVNTHHGIARTYKTSVSFGSSQMCRRNWTSCANYTEIYSVRVWVSRQPTGARLQQVFGTAHKYKLDKGIMGTLVHMQGHGRGCK